MSKTDETSGAGATPTTGTGPIIDKAKAFARERPWATATLATVLGVAFLNTLRGK